MTAVWLAVVALVALPSHGQAADNPIERAGQAARTQSFTAHVDVRWVDSAGEHAVGVDVQSGSGQVQVAGPELTRVWPGTLAAPDVPLAGKYQVVAQPGGYVAGRPTSAVLVMEEGRRVEQLAIDDETGLILRRETFDADGNVVRRVEVEQLLLSSGPTGGTAKPAVSKVKAKAKADVMSGLPSSYRAPAALAGGYQRLGAYRQGSAIQLVYSDGLHGLSVFAQPGQLLRGRLPAGGDRVSVAGRPGNHYRWPGGDVVTWQNKGVVYTAVGDAPLADVLAAAASLPGARPLPFGNRLRHACRSLVETLTGGS
jgi:hypothetical protein